MSSIRPYQQLSRNQHVRGQSDIVQFESPPPFPEYSHPQSIAPFTTPLGIPLSTPRGDNSSRNNNNIPFTVPSQPQDNVNLHSQNLYSNSKQSLSNNIININNSDERYSKDTTNINPSNKQSLNKQYQSSQQTITTPNQTNNNHTSNILIDDRDTQSNQDNIDQQQYQYKGCYDIINTSNYSNRKPQNSLNSQNKDNLYNQQNQQVISIPRMQHLNEQLGRLPEKEILNEGDQYGIHFSLIQDHNNSQNENIQRNSSLQVNEGITPKQSFFDEQREITFKGHEESRISMDKCIENLPYLSDDYQQQKQQKPQEQEIILRKAGLETQQEEETMRMLERHQSEKKQAVKLMEYSNQLQPSTEREDLMFPPSQHSDSSRAQLRQISANQQGQVLIGSWQKDVLMNQYTPQINEIKSQQQTSDVKQVNSDNILHQSKDRQMNENQQQLVALSQLNNNNNSPSNLQEITNNKTIINHNNHHYQIPPLNLNFLPSSNSSNPIPNNYTIKNSITNLTSLSSNDCPSSSPPPPSKLPTAQSSTNRHNSNSNSGNTPKFNKQQSSSAEPNSNINVNPSNFENSFNQPNINQLACLPHSPPSQFSQQILQDLLQDHSLNTSNQVLSGTQKILQANSTKERNFSQLATSNVSPNSYSNSKHSFPDITKLDNMLHKQQPTYTRYLNQIDKNTGSTRTVLSHVRNNSAISMNTNNSNNTSMYYQQQQSNQNLNCSFNNNKSTLNIQQQPQHINNFDDNNANIQSILPQDIQEGSLEKLNDIHTALHNQLAPLSPISNQHNPIDPQTNHLSNNNNNLPYSFGPSSHPSHLSQITPVSSQSSSTTIPTPFEYPKRTSKNNINKEYVNCSEVKDQNSNLSFIHDRITEQRQTILNNALQSIKQPQVDCNNKRNSSSIHGSSKMSKNQLQNQLGIVTAVTSPARALLQHYSSAKNSRNNSPNHSFLKLRSPKDIKAGIINNNDKLSAAQKENEIEQYQLLLEQQQKKEQELMKLQQQQQQILLQQQLLEQQKQQELYENELQQQSQYYSKEYLEQHHKSLKKLYNSIEEQINQLNITDIQPTQKDNNNITQDIPGYTTNSTLNQQPLSPSNQINSISSYNNPNQERLEMLLKKIPSSSIPVERIDNNNNNKPSDSSFIRNTSNISSQLMYQGNNNNNSYQYQSTPQASKQQQQQQQQLFSDISNISNIKRLSNPNQIPVISPRMREIYNDLDDSRIQEKISSIKSQLSTLTKHNAYLLQQDSQLLFDQYLKSGQNIKTSRQSKSPSGKTQIQIPPMMPYYLHKKNNSNSTKKINNSNNNSILNISNISNGKQSNNKIIIPPGITNNNTPQLQKRRAVSALNGSGYIPTPPFSPATYDNQTNTIINQNNISKPSFNQYKRNSNNIIEDDLFKQTTPRKNNLTINQYSTTPRTIPNNQLTQKTTNSPNGFDVVIFESKSDNNNNNNTNNISIQSPDKNLNNTTISSKQVMSQLNKDLNNLSQQRPRALSSISSINPVIDNVALSTVLNNSSAKNSQNYHQQQLQDAEHAYFRQDFFLSKKVQEINPNGEIITNSTVSQLTPSGNQLSVETFNQKKYHQPSSSIPNTNSIFQTTLFQKDNNTTPTGISSKFPKSSANTPRTITNTNNLNSLSVSKKSTLNLNNSGNNSKQNSSRSLTPVNKTPKNQDYSINPPRKEQSSYLDLSQNHPKQDNNPIDKLVKGEPIIASSKMSERELRDQSKKKYENLPDVKKMREQQQHNAQKIIYHKQRNEKIKQYDEMCRAKNKQQSVNNNY